MRKTCPNGWVHYTLIRESVASPSVKVLKQQLYVGVLVPKSTSKFQTMISGAH